MPKKLLDCRKQECPQPIIQIRRLLEASAPASITVLVDNEAALENVSRFLASQGYSSSFAREPGLWRITGELTTRPAPASAKPESTTAPLPSPEKRMLVMIIAPVFGSGDDGLGIRLMKNFLASLNEQEEPAWRIVMLNGGVTLATPDSPVIEELRRLEDSGVSILVCGACLEHFGLLDKKAVGQTTNMLDVVSSMQLADTVVRL
jgi:selenium metabolism protein YedF